MSIKQERIGGRIRQILTELLLGEVSDPRIVGISVTRVELDSELNVARVWVAAIGEEENAKEIIEGFKHAKGFLRSEIGRRIRLRKVPDLVFRWDSSVEQTERIEKILNDLNLPLQPTKKKASDENDDSDDSME